MKLCDFDCSRVVNVNMNMNMALALASALALNSSVELARDENGKIKFSASWVSPEVFEAASSGSQRPVYSSFAIDLFSLGLLIEVLCRRYCDASTTALPSPHHLDPDRHRHELVELFGQQERLYGVMESLKGNYSQTSIVRRLLLLNGDERGRESAESMLASYLSTHGTRGLQMTADQSRSIEQLNKLIEDLQSNRVLTRSELEGSLGDLMIQLSSLLSVNKNEIIDQIVNVNVNVGESGRSLLIDNLKQLILK